MLFNERIISYDPVSFVRMLIDCQYINNKDSENVQ